MNYFLNINLHVIEFLLNGKIIYWNFRDIIQTYKLSCLKHIVLKAITIENVSTIKLFLSPLHLTDGNKNKN